MKRNYWKWSTVLLTLLLTTSWVVQGRVSHKNLTLAACWLYKYNLLERQIKTGQYTPFPKTEIGMCQGLEGFDTEIPDYTKTK